SISPDYAESTRFADDWLSVRQGTDGALAMAMGHVILNEYYHQSKTKYFEEYAKKYTDFPFSVLIKEENGTLTADRFLNAQDLGIESEHAEWKPAMFNKHINGFSIPQGTMGSRWDNNGKWNLHLVDENTEEKIEPVLSFLGMEDEIMTVNMPYFDENGSRILKRNIPVKKIEINGKIRYVTTVYDLMLANYGINRGLGGEAAHSYDDKTPFTPAWQEDITGVDRNLVIKIAREFAQNAIDTKGRSMIIIGAGVNHWYNSDTIYRAIIN